MGQDLKWIDAIRRVLQEEKQPLHYSDITDKILEKEYVKSVGATPANSVSAAISLEIKNNGDKSDFIKVARGTFNLKSNPSSIEEEEEEEEK